MAAKGNNESLVKFLKEKLQTNQLEYTGYSGQGCINEGQSFKTDTGVVFVKINKLSGVPTGESVSHSRVVFNGEYNSLVAIKETGTVRVPKPGKVC